MSACSPELVLFQVGGNETLALLTSGIAFPECHEFIKRKKVIVPEFSTQLFILGGRDSECEDRGWGLWPNRIGTIYRA